MQRVRRGGITTWRSGPLADLNQEIKAVRPYTDVIGPPKPGEPLAGVALCRLEGPVPRQWGAAATDVPRADRDQRRLEQVSLHPHGKQYCRSNNCPDAAAQRACPVRRSLRYLGKEGPARPQYAQFRLHQISPPESRGRLHRSNDHGQHGQAQGSHFPAPAE